LAHGGVVTCTGMTPPPVSVSGERPVAAADDATRRDLGRSYVRRRGKIREVRLVGRPSESGQAHVALLYDDQVAIEREMRDQFRHYVPWAWARMLILDVSRLQFRALDEALFAERRAEIAAQAAAFTPDPFADMMPTYQRFVFLHSLYDIMLSFEHSPLVGCTSFVFGPEQAAGHTLMGRNFDFEGPQILDDDKAVFLMVGDGPVPYASVSWPGFVGAATGMNAEGVAIVVHGARAGETRARGAPVAHTVRQLLGRARTTAQALALLQGLDPMVPHMLLIADASGDAAAVERVPGAPAFVRRRGVAALPLTNHFEGPHASDAKNLAVRKNSTSVARRDRLDEILANTETGATVQRAVEILRDKRGRGGKTRAAGDRDAIDAGLATHSVVMDTTARVLWVSEGPHAAGRFVRFDLRQLLEPSYEPRGAAEVEAIE
jgi:isopenicillin-N N-acyltransferase like protein